jgi:hypothetical protein
VPLSDTDWTAPGPDPRAALVIWSEVVAAALVAGLPPDRFGAETDRSTRSGAAEELAPLAPSALDPPPTLTVPARFTDRVDVTLWDTTEDRRAAAVLFVTPDNKADSDGALAFAVRAAALLGAGATVVVIDALPGPPSWATHLHSLVGVYPIARRPRNGEAPILVVHPERVDGAPRFAVWHHLVAPGFPLPTVVVPVRGAGHLTLDLEATYLDARQRGRLPE